MTMTKTTVHWEAAVGQQALHFTAMHLYNNISSYYMHETLELIWSHKQAACSSKNFEEIIFVVEVKSTKTVKFIVHENFPLYGMSLALIWINTLIPLMSLSMQTLSCPDMSPHVSKVILHIASYVHWLYLWEDDRICTPDPSHMYLQ